jgi:hypothetical protein
VPFTGSHPAAILPLLGRRFLGLPLPASALVFGSMAPDTRLYARALDADVALTHSAVGIVGIDAVFALAMWLVWHGLLVAPALAAAPPAIRARCGDGRPGVRHRVRGLRDALALYAAFVLAASTHVLLDSFTHFGRWGARHVPILDGDLAGQPRIHWAQFGSSVIGLVILAVYLAHRWTAATPPAPDPGWRIDAAAASAWGFVVLAGALGAAYGASLYPGGDISVFPFLVLTRGVTAAAVVALALAVGWHLRRVASPARRGPG